MSSSSTRFPEDPPNREPTPIPATSKQRKPHGETEANIQVVIRCRRRSEREIQDNSPIIVSSDGPKSKDVSIQMSNPASSLGVVTLPPLRTYSFDLVFGPEADQAMIYHDVVSPMLDEVFNVLQLYSLRLRSNWYWENVSDKSTRLGRPLSPVRYTMQGDLTPTPMGNPSPDAGMIPRVLFRLFHRLEASETDYSVKISYVELYNEELRDLLATDLSEPTGSTQPMGLGNKEVRKNLDNSLKIFDDVGKRGVMIQGLEEIAVKDSRDALALLTKGSHEELLKVGKLNLVDLAGSENIGRSGAENKRAREAGMINQSLLTLGRVINALVDKAQHIRYR